MKEKQITSGIGITAILLTVIMTGCLDDGEDIEGVIMIDGEEFSISSIFDDHELRTIVSGDVTYQGVFLDKLVIEAGVRNPENTQYRITASDGWNQEVTWGDMKEGVLVRENIMTAFSGLPGKYRIKNVESIEPVDSMTIEVNGRLFTRKQPFHIIDDPVDMQDGGDTVTGVYLSSVVNITGLAYQEKYYYNIVDEYGYNRTLSWDDMKKGILVEENMSCFFSHLSNDYNVTDIARIEVI